MLYILYFYIKIKWVFFRNLSITTSWLINDIIKAQCERETEEKKGYWKFQMWLQLKCLNKLVSRKILWESLSDRQIELLLPNVTWPHLPKIQTGVKQQVVFSPIHHKTLLISLNSDMFCIYLLKISVGN